MRVALGSDETGVLPDAVAEVLRERGCDVTLVGPPAGGDEEWADVALEVGRRVAAGGADVGVLFCWSGTGVAIAANKVDGVRAALCADAETARLARKYNHANVLVMSLRLTSAQVGREITAAFLDAPWGGEEFDVRNVRRVEAAEAERGR